MAIVDSNGDKVVEYRYDAWGRDIGCTLTSDIGELNPFRYRGYVYDEETELYYLRSRYYNAGIGRFVSADCIIIGIGNLYSYCNNKAIIFTDTTGCRPTFDAVDAYAKPSQTVPVVYDIPKCPKLAKKLASRYAIMELHNNAQEARRKIEVLEQRNNSITNILVMALLWFKNQVNHGQRWDYKAKGRKPKWWFSDKISIEGTDMNREDYGNFNYGYVGTAMGIPKSVLIAGSFYAHYTSHHDLNEDPHDLDMIEKGIEFYNMEQNN